MDTLWTDLFTAWLRTLQARTPAEAVQIWMVDGLLVWHEAVTGGA